MKSLTLKIEGMRCDACAKKIAALVTREPGVHGANVSLEQGRARVLFDPKVIEEQRLVEVIEAPGYRVLDGLEADIQGNRDEHRAHACD